MTKSLEQIQLFLDQDGQGTHIAATARYVIAEGTTLRADSVRVEHPALKPHMQPDAIPRELWVTVIEAIRQREGLG